MPTTERMKRIRTLATLVVAAMALSLLLISAKPTQASPVAFGDLGIITVAGGESSEWFFWNNAGTSNGLPVGGSCDNSPGLAVADAQLPTHNDAFDGGLKVFVDNQQYVSPDTVDLTGTTLTSGPVSLSGLNTSVQYYVSPTYATLRTFISLNNPTTNSITVPVTVATNLGSDRSTQIINTSSGDTTFTTSDSYIITDDSTDAGDPTVTSLVAAGSGSPRTHPSAVSITVFDCADTSGVLVTYDVTIPAGQTRSLLLFNQLNTTPTEATADVGVFNDNTTLAGTDFLAGLSSAALATVVNFDFDATAPKVISTFPPNGGEVGPAANIRATFSEEMQSASVKNAFKLFKKGSTNQIDATVTYDAATDIATLNPTNNLRRGVTYKAVVTTVAKDMAGNRLDQDSSTTGLQQKRWFFRVDD